MKYEFMENHRSDYAVRKMCKALNVYESGYYRWKNRKKTKRQLEDEQLVPIIRKVHEENKKIYGAGRLRTALEAECIYCSEGRI